MRRVWGILAVGVLTVAGCATGSAITTRTAMQPKVDVHLVDDHPAKMLDPRSRITGPGGERVLLFSGRSVPASEIAGIVVTPGWRARETAGRTGTSVYPANEYAEVHVLLKPQAWGRLTEVRHAFDRIAIVRGGEAIALLPVVAVRDEELILASRKPAEELAWVGPWDRISPRERHAAYLEWLQQRHRADTQEPETLMLLAEESLLGPSRDCKRAEGLSLGLMGLAPEQPTAGELLSETVSCYIQWGDHESALRTAERILDRNPDFGSSLGLRSRVADSYWIRGDGERATEQLTAHIEYLKRSSIEDKDQQVRDALDRIDQIRHELTPGAVASEERNL